MTTPIDFGVCRLAVVSVRKELDLKSEVVTQLLFGDHYEVWEMSKDQKSLRIRINFDDTYGWIDKLQHHVITPEYYEQIGLANFKITTDIVSTILYKKSQLTIVMGSIVPISGTELFKMEEQFAFNGETKSLGQRRDVDYVKSIATKYLNAPHQPGGKNPFGIDAPGFVQMVFRISGYALPRDVRSQYAAGKSVASHSDAQPGDIAFFQSKDGKINHCGIVLDDQKITHCAGKVRTDYLMEEGILASETRIFTHTLAGIRRIL
jgi:hypothetical protein